MSRVPRPSLLCLGGGFSMERKNPRHDWGTLNQDNPSPYTNSTGNGVSSSYVPDQHRHRRELDSQSAQAHPPQNQAPDCGQGARVALTSPLLKTKREIVDKALELLVRSESRKGILRYYGSGVWEGDLKASRRNRV